MYSNLHHVQRGPLPGGLPDGACQVGVRLQPAEESLVNTQSHPPPVCLSLHYPSSVSAPVTGKHLSPRGASWPFVPRQQWEDEGLHPVNAACEGQGGTSKENCLSKRNSCVVKGTCTDTPPLLAEFSAGLRCQFDSSPEDLSHLYCGPGHSNLPALKTELN